MALPPPKSNKQSNGTAPVQSHSHTSICLLIIIFRAVISGSRNSRQMSYTRNHPWKYPVFIPCLYQLPCCKNSNNKETMGQALKLPSVQYFRRLMVTHFKPTYKLSRVGYKSITVNAYCVCSWINYQCALNMDIDVVSSYQVSRERTSLVCWLASSE
jgi:hypothetical protein